MYRVQWKGFALRDLASYWTDADSVLRKEITAASHEIDRRLAADPWSEGEARGNRRKITFVAPFSVVFRIEQDDQTVSVLQVRLFRPRKK